MPAGGERWDASRGGDLAVRCQLRGQYSASGRNLEGEGGRIASRLATTDKRAIARAFGTTGKPSGTVMLRTEALPIRGTSPAERQPTSTESPDAISPTVNEARSFPTVQNAKRGAKQVRGKGENRTS